MPKKYTVGIHFQWSGGSCKSESVITDDAGKRRSDSEAFEYSEEKKTKKLDFALLNGFTQTHRTGAMQLGSWYHPRQVSAITEWRLVFQCEPDKAAWQRGVKTNRCGLTSAMASQGDFKEEVAQEGRERDSVFGEQFRNNQHGQLTRKCSNRTSGHRQAGFRQWLFWKTRKTGLLLPWKAVTARSRTRTCHPQGHVRSPHAKIKRLLWDRSVINNRKLTCQIPRVDKYLLDQISPE